MPYVFVDIEAELVNHINTELGIRVSTRVPNPRPEEFIQLRRQGGNAGLTDVETSRVMQDQSLLDLYVWAPDESQCWQIASSLRNVLMTLPSSGVLTAPVYKVSEVMGPTTTDDTIAGVTDSPRLWMSYSISTRIRG